MLQLCKNWEMIIQGNCGKYEMNYKILKGLNQKFF